MDLARGYAKFSHFCSKDMFKCCHLADSFLQQPEINFKVILGLVVFHLFSFVYFSLYIIFFSSQHEFLSK